MAEDDDRFPDGIDRRVSGWDELQAALHDDGMVPERPDQGAHRRSGYLFRGMAAASWPLATSLERHWPAGPEVELPSLRSVGKYASSGTLVDLSDWERLAIAQHNGLPTRCLDWTASPLIAAHFATFEAEHMDKDGVIWCVSADTVRNELLPDQMFGTLGNESAFVFDIPMLKRYWPTLADFDKTAQKYEDALLFFEPPSIDQRIHNQWGLFSVMNGADKEHDAYLKRHVVDHPQLVVRVIIEADAKRSIRDMLDQNNITERMLFPGLPGLCDWLRRYYGPSKR